MANISERVVVEVEKRTGRGTNECRRIRRAGRVPANVYGLKVPPFSASVDPRRIEEVLRLETGRNTIFTLSLAGQDQSRQVMLRELQRDPVNDRLVHVEFVRVDPKKKMHLAIPIRMLGTPVGVKLESGIVDFVHRTVEVSCLPGNIPEHMDVDVSELHIGQHVSVKDLIAVADVEILDDPESIIAVVAASRAEEEPAEGAEGEEAAEVAPTEGAADAAAGEEGEKES